MPSRRHQLLAYAIPRLRKASEIESEPAERARVEQWHAGLDRALPTKAVRGFDRHFDVVIEDLGFASYTITPRDREVERTIYYVHGGAFMAPIDAFHVRYATRLATALGARVVMPDYPLAPEHSWRDSHDTLVEHAAQWAEAPGGIVLAGDSAGGGLALAIAIGLRDRGLPQPTHLVLHAPWVDLTESTPDTEVVARQDPWLKITKVRAYAAWWAGSTDDLARHEVSPALADLSGLPPAILLYGTRDLLAPGCRLLAARAAETDWNVTVVEEPGLIHVYGLLPLVPEAEQAFRQVVDFLS